MNQPHELEAMLSRRDLLGSAAALAASTAVLGPLSAQAGESAQLPKRKIKLGLVGCGGRGVWLGKFFQKHGGYEVHAVADYFANIAEAGGNELKVDKARRFSGLSGYKRVIESGVEAVAVVNVPYFHVEQARAAVDAGLHVYLAKPVAVDVPGCLTIGAAAKEATRKQRCFLVDYQLPVEPVCIEVAKRIRNGALGKLVHLVSFGIAGAWPDPPLSKTIEGRLREGVWLSDTALSGDTIVSYDIHIIDGILWALGQRSVSACGRSRTSRPEPHGDRTDSAAVIYELGDGTIWSHVTQSLNNNIDIASFSASLCGLQGTAHLQYGGKNYIRGGPQHYSDTCGSIYDDGAVRNIAGFYSTITEGRFENPTAARAVDGTLTAILGREAAARRGFLTMDDLLKENKRLEVDLKGLKE